MWCEYLSVSVSWFAKYVVTLTSTHGIKPGTGGCHGERNVDGMHFLGDGVYVEAIICCGDHVQLPSTHNASY